MAHQSCFRAAFVFILALHFTEAHGQAASSQDTQEWNDVQLSVPIAPNIDFSMIGTLRLGRDPGRPVDERIGVGFTFKAGQYITASAAYLHIGMQPSIDRRLFEERALFPIAVRVPLGKFTLSDRNQFERRMRHPGVDSSRYRNRLQLEHPLGSTRMKLSIFFSDEVFYDWSVHAWVRNRAAVGVTKVLNKHLSGDLYYLRQNDSHSVPGDLHAIGTALRVKL